MNATYNAPYSANSGSSSSYHSDQTSSSSYTNAANMSSDAPITPDVVANPWNTSLLWSAGIVDNRDPQSTFWPATHWHNVSVPANVDTQPIDYYYSSSTAGDSVNFYFSGHGLSVLDFRGPTRGKYNVTIDNVTSVIIDAYSTTDELASSSGTQLPPAIWTSETIDEGTHYVVMSNLNNVSDMNFWGVVINPNNYRPGKSFMPPTSNTKVILIASTVTAVVMLGLFILIGSLFYQYKIVRPRRRFQAQMDSERKDVLRPPRSSSSGLDNSPFRRSSAAASSSRLRLDTNFLASQGDLGRVPSRVAATTDESQYWVRPQTQLAQVIDTRQTSRTPAVFQEILLASPHDSVASSPVDFSPVSEMGVSPTAYSTELRQPLSPLSPTNLASATASTPTHHTTFWDSRPVPYGQSPIHQLPSHRQSNSLNNSHTVLGAGPGAGAGAGASTNYFHHSRVASAPLVNPFQDPSAPASATRLARTGSRRPLPTPPTAASPISPMTTLSPLAAPSSAMRSNSNQNSTPNTPLQSSLSVGRNASQRYRVEQDACSLHLSEDGLFDDHTGETLLPPPYSPRDLGRHFV
ncbi:uncharacterized protein SPSC_03412 [Sporisorium scitamineum]|uniref:Uncharacterized protein n=1 Tax=Sporisorium scitamineum TaxID=49012 RepID=A0A0F7RZY0_9BASI|nr:hypothetical protein [Sporisorium scitamineum]CDU24341.1 uncharacterized protein SPSC_03412 [Sporisorium scitamineum]